MPTLTSLSHTAGPMAGGSLTIIKGSGFSAGANTVTVGGVTATVLPGGTDAELTVIVPASTTPGPKDVEVTNAGVAGTAKLVDAFTYDALVVPPILPTLTGISSASGKPAGGKVVRVFGAGFKAPGAGATTVKFGGINATHPTVLSDTEILVNTPPMTTHGPKDVEVTNANGTATLANAFTYNAPPPPTDSWWKRHKGLVIGIGIAVVAIATLVGVIALVVSLRKSEPTSEVAVGTLDMSDLTKVRDERVAAYTEVQDQILRAEVAERVMNDADRKRIAAAAKLQKLDPLLYAPSEPKPAPHGGGGASY